jgi:hypothetical protein
MHLFWERSAQVSPHRSDRTLIQNFAAAPPRQGAPWNASKRDQILIKSVSNASGSRSCVYIRPSQNLSHPERCPNRVARRGRVEGPAVVSGIERRVEIESQWAAHKRERLGLTLQLVQRNEHPRPVSPTGDVMLSEALFAERRTWTPPATPRVFCQARTHVRRASLAVGTVADNLGAKGRASPPAPPPLWVYSLRIPPIDMILCIINRRDAASSISAYRSGAESEGVPSLAAPTDLLSPMSAIRQAHSKC